MAGHWPSSFFFFFLRFYGQRRSRGPYKRSMKKERGQCPAILTEQAWLIKDLLYGHKVTPSISFNAPANVSARDFNAGNSERATPLG